MENPLISVVIPVYNTAFYLEKCLESVVNQTYQNLQIIIINDGSTDNSVEICQKFANKDNRIEFINKENEGVSVARNLGIEKSKGQWVYFLDSDDFLDIVTFSQLIDYVTQSRTDVLQFGLRSLKGKMLVKEHYPSEYKEYTNLKFFLQENQMKPLSACLHLTKRELIQKHNVLFNPNLKHGEDMLFMYTVFSYAKKITTVKNIFYNQVLSPNSASRKPIEIKVLYDGLTFLDELCRHVKKENLVNEFKEEINTLAKGIFVVPTQMKDNSDYKRNKVDIQKKFRKIYIENQDIFYRTFLKVGFIDIDIVVKVIKFKHSMRKFRKLKL